MNGKKRFIAGGVSTAGLITWLFIKVWSINDVVVATETQVDTNTDEIKELRKLPEKFARLEQKVESEGKADAEFRVEQRAANDRLYDAIIAR